MEKLNSENPAVKFPDIISCLETEEQLKGYVSQTTTGDIKQYVIAPLFLMLRDEIRKSDDIAQTRLFMNLAYLKKFENSFNYTVILVGAFFGFRKFYDIYYEALNLRFYKNFEISQKETTFKGHQEHVTTDTKREVSKIFAADKKVEQQSSNDKSEERQTLKQEDHTKDEEIPIAPTVQQDEKERESDISSHYQKIIEEALVKQLEVKLTDIASMIKERTGKKFKTTLLKKSPKE